jgi:hypothetical protein
VGFWHWSVAGATEETVVHVQVPDSRTVALQDKMQEEGGLHRTLQRLLVPHTFLDLMLHAMMLHAMTHGMIEVVHHNNKRLNSFLAQMDDTRMSW